LGQGVISKDLFSRHYLWPECKRDREVAVDLMCVFKIVIGSNADYFCPDLVTSHKKDSTDGRSLDTVSSPFWHVCTFSQLPFGFWNLLFMEIRLRSSVSNANKSEALQDLLHSFGCDDPDLRKSGTVIRWQNVGKRVGEFLQQISAYSDLVYLLPRCPCFQTRCRWPQTQKIGSRRWSPL
jgi:hypothetical protein